jgi:hypothetical protein
VVNYVIHIRLSVANPSQCNYTVNKMCPLAATFIIQFDCLVSGVDYVGLQYLTAHVTNITFTVDLIYPFITFNVTPVAFRKI